MQPRQLCGVAFHLAALPHTHFNCVYVPEGDAEVWCDKNWTYFQNGVCVCVLFNLCFSLSVCVSRSSSLLCVLFIYLAWGGGWGGQALVMLLLWVLLGAHKVNTLAPEASLNARRSLDDKTPRDPSSRRTLPRPADSSSPPSSVSVPRQRDFSTSRLASAHPSPATPSPSHLLCFFHPSSVLSLLVSAKCDEAGKQAETWECSVKGWRGGAVATGGKCPN